MQLPFSRLGDSGIRRIVALVSSLIFNSVSVVPVSYTHLRVQKQIIVLLEVVYLYFVFTSRQYSSHAHLSEDARFKSRPMSDSISLVKYLCVITNHIKQLCKYLVATPLNRRNQTLKSFMCLSTTCTPVSYTHLI